jgi:outer membrane autotransporter protein
MSAAIAAVMAGWTLPSTAREAVALPGVVGPEGELNGVDTAGSGTLTVNDGQNINTNNDLGGGLTSSAADTGIVLFNGNSTVTGFTGTSGSEFQRIDAGANASVVNFNGDVYAQTLNVTGTGTVNLNGNVRAATLFANDGFMNLGAGKTLTGAVTTASAGTGTLTLNNGSTVVGAIGGASGLRQINVAGGNASITGAVQTLGLNLGANTLNINGALTTNAGGTIATTLASDTVYGKVIATTANIDAGGITVIPTVTGALTIGTNFRIVDAPAGTIAAPVFVVNNNPRYLFSSVPTTTGDVNILLTATPLAVFSTDPGALAVAPILEVNAPAGSDLRTIQDAIAVLPDASSINHALAQLAPGTTNLAAPWVAAQTTRLFEDMSMARMEEIDGLCCDESCSTDQRAHPAGEEKCSTGNHRGSWWGKGLANSGRQDNAGGMNGYDSETFGLMLAYDMPLNDNTRVGFGGAYANTTVDGNNASGRTKIDSYQLNGYFDHTMGTAFVQGLLTAGVDKYEGSRSIIFPGIDRNAKADFDGQQYSALLTAGKHLFVNQTTITPFASLKLSHISVDGYTEKGAGGASLQVASQDYDFVQSGLGVKAERVIRSGERTYAPEMHLKWLHDFKSTTMQQDASFDGTDGTFSAEGIKQDRDLSNVGAGITLLSCDCTRDSWTVKALYDYKWNQSEYSSHQVSLLASRTF